MLLEPVQYLLGLLSGGLVGFSLGLFGGGGSILAVPLMIYVVGVPSAHIAIGTSALAVAANAITSLVMHAGRGNIIWRCAGIYTSAGIAGALLGSLVGKSLDGSKLLLLFSLLMAVVGLLMFMRRNDPGIAGASCNREKAPKVVGYGIATGALSGFFGIGGGFLIVPGLVASTGMPLLNAIGTSLVAVAGFGLTTTLSYAYSGLVDWVLAGVLIMGGVAGGLLGTGLAGHLAARKGRLHVAFAGLILLVAGYMATRTLLALS